MIMIPTSDLTGILNDAVPFASDDEDLPAFHCLRIEWDGAMLHTLTMDGIRVAISSWHPDDKPDEDTQDALGTEWGGADEPWTAIVGHADAVHLAKTFKLPVKRGHIPLVVDFDAARGRLAVTRYRDTDLSEIRVAVNTLLLDVMDIRRLVADAQVTEKVEKVAFNPRLLADFAKVRPRGAMRMWFGGETHPVRVEIGKRFTGLIMPVREKAEGES